ncbi:FG-GAP-like repeat-containing protein [Salisaeta longa]|uniref:FG-GAP-like repeat-containing protein n=1 Tax=Salisaeta longa TaxID=503170 RepID=UPI0003B63975|nr:FG-GAP-like repeat-containing protein [Salisaeta longa]
MRLRILLFTIAGLLACLPSRAQVASRTVTSSIEEPRALAAADLTGDGRAEILTAAQGTDTVAWYEATADSTFTRHVLSDAMQGAASVTTPDLDADGDRDVLATAYDTGTVYWFENRGAGATPRFTGAQPVGTGLLGAIDARAADVDGDGDRDMVAAGFLSDQVVWYPQQADGSFGAPDTLATDLDGARRVLALHNSEAARPTIFVLAQRAQTLVALQPTAAGGVQPVRVTTFPERPRDVHAADIDGDGTTDLLVAHDTAIVWLRNTVQGFEAPQAIMPIQGGYAVAASDLDADGDAEVLAAANTGDVIWWVENRLRQDGTFAAPDAVGGPADGAVAVTTARVNADAAPDVVSAAWWARTVRVDYSQGLGVPRPPRDVTAAPIREQSVEVAWAPSPAPDVQAYAIYRSATPFGDAVANEPVGTAPAAATSYTDTGLSASTTYHYRVAAIDREGRLGPPSDTAQARPRPVAPRAPTLTSVRVADATATARWRASTAPDVVGYHVYRARQPFETASAALRVTEAPVAQRQFADASLETGGTLYYRAAAVDTAGLQGPLSNTVRAFYYPARVSINAVRTFGEARAVTDYHLVALPGRTDVPLRTTVPGTPTVDWQAYWEPGAQRDSLVAFDEGAADRFVFAPGRGFWLIGTVPWRVEAQVPTVPLRGDSAAVIPVHAGWNIISNPLEKDVLWADVARANGGALQPLWRFDAGFQQASLFQSARGGEGYYFLNTTGRDSLRIPYPGAPTPPIANAEAPTLALTVRDGDGHASTVRVRFRPDARAGTDRFDQFAPTTRFEAVSLRVPMPEAPHPEATALATTVQPTPDEGGRIPLTLHAAPGTRVQLTLSGPLRQATTPAVLHHPATGARYALGSKPQAISVTKPRTALALLLGPAAKQTSTAAPPATATLRPPYPNPVREHTTLAYALPTAQRVQLQVYDVLGRRVATLVDARQAAGRHEVQWAPEADAQALPSGVYFVRLQTNGAAYTRKLVLVR